MDANGKIDHIKPIYRNEAHRIIEECMLAANVCSAEFLQEKEVDALFRNHETPSEEKLETLRGFLIEFGLFLDGGNSPTVKHYGQLIKQISSRPDAHLLQTVLLRSMQQAVYSNQNKGHFGLAYESYTHFTSPIRRYPDLIVHRGAVVTFVGYVRDFDKKDSKHLINMDLEHYPGMTEKVLEDIEEKANERWSLSAIEIVEDKYYCFANAWF